MHIRRARTAARRAAVTTVAVAAAAMPLLAAGPACADARSSHQVVNDVQGASVVQVGRVPIARSGNFPAATARFTATLPAGVTGPVHARLSFDSNQLPDGSYPPWHVARGLRSTCSVSGSAFQPCAWDSPTRDDPDAGLILLQLPTTEATGTITYDIRINVVDYAFTQSYLVLTGAIELTDDAGAALTSGAANIGFVDEPQGYADRTALYARDAAGVLWNYQGTGDAAVPFRPRARIGGGWNAYTVITSLNGTTADGRGDAVARDSKGVLWYYRGTGDMGRLFAPRTRVGAGWNIYTALFGLGADPDVRAGGGSLLARDKAGDLWLYRGSGVPATPFEARVKVGWGWNAYTAITAFGDGVLARDAAGVLWSYSGTGNPAAPLTRRVRVGGGWNAYTAITGIRDATNTFASPDLVARDKAGRLRLYTTDRNYHVPDPHPRLVGGGWQIYTALF